MFLDHKQHYFIAGTDTNVGKTTVTGLFARFLLQKFRCVTQKWVQTGRDADIDQHLYWMGKSWNDYAHYKKAMCPYHFSPAVSPHFAADQCQSIIQEHVLTTAFNSLKKFFDCVLVEGAGGLFVPFSSTLLQIDVLERLKLPAILVVANRLGAINHTLLSIDALNTRNIPIKLIVLNQTIADTDSKIIKSNDLFLRERINSKIPILSMPYNPSISEFFNLMTVLTSPFSK
jgi:dethiobiotin synthetase